MATKRTVEAKLRELIARLDGAEEAQGSLARGLPEARVLAVRILDLDAEYWTVMNAGRMDTLRRGAPERADITIRVASDDLVDLVDGRRSMLSSMISGQVKVEASLADLLRLRRLA